MTEKVIGIVGSRRRATTADLNTLIEAFNKIYHLGDTIVSGGCPTGADNFAEGIAAERGIPIIIHRPNKADLDKKLLKINPRAAFAKINFARNTLIAQDSDVLIALVAADRKGGTENTVQTAIELGKQVILA